MLANRVAQTTTTDGLGNLTLGPAIFGHRAFADVFSAIERFPYCIAHKTVDEWEIGEGYLTAGGLLVRDEITDSSESFTAPTVINLSAGTKDVFLPALGLTSIITISGTTLEFEGGILVGTA